MNPQSRVFSGDGYGPSAASPAPINDHHWLLRLQLEAVMTNGRSFLPAYISFAVAAVFIINPGVTHSTLLGWLAVYLGYTIARTVATSAYHSDPRNSSLERVLFWRRVVFVSALTHGLLLGSLAILAMPGLQYAHQLVLTCFVLLVTAGSIIYVSPLLPALLALISATLLPFVAAWWLQRHSVGAPVAQFLVVGWMLNMYLSWMQYRASCRMFRLTTDKETLAHELKEKNRQLEVLDNARIQLFAVTSHDLRQPVHALSLMLAQLSEYEDPQALRVRFDKLGEMSEMVAEMLLELLDLSNLERNAYALQIKPVSLNAVLRQLKISQEPGARRKGLALRIDAEPQLHVLAEANLLRRILLNLLSNAIKYTVVGTVSIDCQAQRENVIIRVSDTGIGIPHDQIDAIFETYVRLDSSTADREGVGLGLAIVRLAVSAQGFGLKVSSNVGVGSVFELTVPRAAAPQAAGVPLDDDEGRTSVLGECIAIVDDDTFARQALVGLLESWGYTTASGATINEVLASIVEGRRPMLIISDYHLSRIESGPDAIVAIRKFMKDPSIRAILLTADMQASYGDLLGVEIAHKPLGPGVLKQKLAHLLRMHRLENDRKETA